MLRIYPRKLYQSGILLMILGISWSFFPQFISRSSFVNNSAKAQVCSRKDNIMLVLDNSSSMFGPMPPYGSKNDALKAIVSDFINTLNLTEDSVGITIFHGDADLYAPVGSAKSKLLSVISSYGNGDGTSIDLGLKVGDSNMPPAPAGGQNFIVLVTDGMTDRITETEAIASKIRSKKEILMSLGIGRYIDEPLLQEISTPGYYFNADSSGQIKQFFNAVADEVNKCKPSPTPKPSTVPVDPGVSQTPTPTTPSVTPTPLPKPPVYDSFSIKCDKNTPFDPYSIDLAFEVYSFKGASISDIEVALAPSKLGPASFYYKNGSITGPTSTAVLVSSQAGLNYSSSSYSIQNKSFPPGRATPLFRFTIQFLGGATTFFENFRDGADVYIYLEDSAGLTNTVGGKMEQVESKFMFDSYSKCARAYYSTSGGDFRSYEPGAYGSKLGTNVTYGQEGNKYWQTQNATKDSYSAIDNSVEDFGLPRSSSYTFEAKTPINPRSSINIAHNFNVEVPDSNPPISMQKDILRNFAEAIEDAVTPIKDLQRFDITSDSSSFPGKVNRDPKTKELSIDLADIKNTDAVVIISDNDYENVIISDDKNSNTHRIIVWCKTLSCNLKIKPSGNINSLTINPDKQVSYDPSPVKSLYTKRARVFFNYNTSDVKAFTPIDSPFTSGPISVPSTRIIELLDDGDTKNNFYGAGLLTDGFVMTSHSKKTDILKGFVIARGIIANATDQGNGNLYFKDFPYPFLHVDFDPKYHIEFYQVLFKHTDIAGGTFVGL